MDGEIFSMYFFAFIHIDTDTDTNQQPGKQIENTFYSE